jgi:hypothetical protein
MGQRLRHSGSGPGASMIVMDEQRRKRARDEQIAPERRPDANRPTQRMQIDRLDYR